MFNPFIVKFLSGVLLTAMAGTISMTAVAQPQPIFFVLRAVDFESTKLPWGQRRCWVVGPVQNGVMYDGEIMAQQVGRANAEAALDSLLRGGQCRR